VHDRGRVLADLACAIADGARVISDFRVMADQRELFGLVASVPTAWRTLAEIARSGTRAQTRIIAAVSTARRHAWAQATARHGALPGVRLADRTLEGVTCIRLDATVTFAHSDKEFAEANFKGFGHHPLLAACDNTGGEPLAWMLRRGSAGSNTAADHITLADAAIAALPPAFRRRLMITVDGAGASHDLIGHLDKLAARRGYELTYPAGWALTGREKAALRTVPEQAWQAATGARGKVRERRADDACASFSCAHRACWIEEAHVTELTGLLRCGPAGDQLARLARHDARLRPTGTAAPRRPAHLVRGGGRLAVHAVGHQPARGRERLAGPGRLHRRRAPGPRPCRGRHPHRQGCRPGPLPLSRLCYQRRLADRRDDRPDHAHLAQAAGSRRRPGQSRA
jgi:hypothetical protein